MTTKKKRLGSGWVDDGRDKPDYAADLFHDVKPKVKEEKKAVDDGPKLADAMQASVRDKLEQMKAQMQAVAKPTTAVAPKASGLTRVIGRKKMDVVEDDGKLSFAELFDSQEDGEENSFEEMLKESKQDWKSYK